MKRSRNNNLKNQENQGVAFDAFSVIFKTVLITFGFLWLFELKNSAQSSLRSQKRQLQDFLPFSSIFVEEIDVKKIISKPEEISHNQQIKKEENDKDSQKIVKMVQEWSPTSSTQINTQTVRDENRNMTTKNIDNNIIEDIAKIEDFTTEKEKDKTARLEVNEGVDEPLAKLLNSAPPGYFEVTDDFYNSNKQTDKAKPYCDDLFQSQVYDNHSIPIRSFRPKLDWYNKNKIDQQFVKNFIIKKHLLKGGCFTPKSYCIVRESVAVIVPYRSRSRHLKKFMQHMHRFLQKQHREYCLIIVNQADIGMFNRAKLMNVGYDFVKNDHYFWKKELFEKINQNSPTKNYVTSDFTSPTCLFFADVDLLPEDLRNLYGCFGYRANHNCDRIQIFNYRVRHISGHTISSGGVFSISSYQYENVNGHPNRYFSWGKEDWDMAFRVRKYDSLNVEKLLYGANIPENRQRDTDFMNNYIHQVTEIMSGGRFNRSGLVRSYGHGFYFALPHKHGFTSSKSFSDFLQGSPYKNLDGNARVHWHMEDYEDLDGLNSLFYEIENVSYDPTITFLNAEIRPVVPRKFEFSVENTSTKPNRLFYYENFIPSKSQYKSKLSSCQMVRFYGITNRNWRETLSDHYITFARSQNMLKTKEKREEMIREREQTCLDGNKYGDQCNAVTFDSFLEKPFPLFSINYTSPMREADPEIVPYMSIRSCPNNFGGFQVLPDVILNSEESQSISLNFNFSSNFLQLPHNIVANYRVWYEGNLITDRLNFLKTKKMNPEDQIKKYTEMVQNYRSQYRSTKNGIDLEVNYEDKTIHFYRTDFYQQLLPGMYFVHELIADAVTQPLVDKFTIFRVKILEGTHLTTTDKNEKAKKILVNASILDQVKTSHLDKNDQINKYFQAQNPIISRVSNNTIADFYTMNNNREQVKYYEPYKKNLETEDNVYIKKELKNYVNQFIKSERGQLNYPHGMTERWDEKFREIEAYDPFL